MISVPMVFLIAFCAAWLAVAGITAIHVMRRGGARRDISLVAMSGLLIWISGVIVATFAEVRHWPAHGCPATGRPGACSRPNMRQRAGAYAVSGWSGLAEVAVSPDGGISGWFIALFAILAVASVGTTIWRMSVLRSGGLNPFVAREQLEARLNQRLQANPPPQAATERPIEERLAELEDLHERGVITDAELAAGRTRIIAGD